MDPKRNFNNAEIMLELSYSGITYYFQGHIISLLSVFLSGNLGAVISAVPDRHPLVL
jgi:hypothetical protein